MTPLVDVNDGLTPQERLEKIFEESGIINFFDPANQNKEAYEHHKKIMAGRKSKPSLKSKCFMRQAKEIIGQYDPKIDYTK